MPAGPHAHILIGALAAGEAARALDAFCDAEGLPDELAWRLRVALDEIVTNIVTHGAAGPRSAGGEGPRALDVWFQREGSFVELTVADDGPAFDPLSRPDPVVTLPLEQRQPGGLGIVLVKALMDDVRYERTTRNVLTMRKRIDGGSVA
jgi:serine/threonine-protein kinase RsbW